MAKTPLYLLLLSTAALAAPTRNPSWWNKYQQLLQNGPSPLSTSPGLTVGTNVDVSNECGPQSETYITLDPTHPKVLAAGSNEIFRLPMRGYFSSNGGASWGGVDLPLPAPLSGTNDTRFGSDPTLAFDTSGNLFYGYIVVFFGAGRGVNGTEMAVARSTDGGKTYPSTAFFSFSSGGDHFNDKPMITADTSAASPFRDNVYIAWDAASGGSISGGIRVGASSDQGETFSITRADNPGGPGKGIGAIPFVGPNGQLYVAWNDYAASQITFNRSIDGGATWGTAHPIARQSLGFQALIPAQSFRGALVYPACDVDRSTGPRRGRLVCSWMDMNLNSAGNTDILVAFSDDEGDTWSSPVAATDRLGGVDRFNHWLSTDPTTGDVFVSFYDTRNDTTGARYMFDEYLSVSTDGGRTFAPNVRVSTGSSNEHDCNGVFPCSAINYGNQTGDYEGLVAFGGVAHAVWTDSRRNQQTSSSCPRGLMEEVFTAAVSQ
ncbi:MAG: exo-alpha-sialidase [Deltaproteobacteria bacterium]|nr:MAG: exo-alpha-sialidase [Deltaproteobacteria bacterium]